MTQPARLVTIDAFRGLTILTMILVNTPGSWEHVYAPLLHAPWHGCTPTDLVFPSFVFISGVSMWFSFKSYGQKMPPELRSKLLRRVVLIFAIGLALNAFPFFGRDYSQLRIMGVLQRTALAYGLGAFACLLLSVRQLAVLTGAILLGYWWVLWQFGAGDPYSLEGNVATAIDRLLLGDGHLWHGKGVPFDPEGLLSTLPATASLILGYFTGKLMDSQPDRIRMVRQLVPLGLASLLLGYWWGWVLPVNKSLWTSSYVLYCAGIDAVLLALFVWILDVRRWQAWAHPLVVFGTNPLFAFVLSGLLVKIMFLITAGTTSDGKPLNLYRWLYEHVFVPLAGPLNGSLLFAVSFIALCWMILLFMYNRRIFVKI